MNIQKICVSKISKAVKTVTNPYLSEKTVQNSPVKNLDGLTALATQNIPIVKKISIEDEKLIKQLKEEFDYSCLSKADYGSDTLNELFSSIDTKAMSQGKIILAHLMF